jgi:aryl-alcohol dehydrogenase-like predicted oxidoreductase
MKSPPDWLSPKSIDQAQKVNLLAKKHQCSLDELAHRFLLNFKDPFKIVLGASNFSELDNTLKAIGSGPLNPVAFEEILTTLN